MKIKIKICAEPSLIRCYCASIGRNFTLLQNDLLFWLGFTDRKQQDDFEEAYRIDEFQMASADRASYAANLINRFHKAGFDVEIA